MFGFVTKALKVGVASAVLLGLAGAGAFALMGRHRTHAVVSEIQGSLLDTIDAHIDNPTVLRSQLRELEKEYPRRIAQVQGDLAEIRHEISELEREVAVSERVVALADEDLGRLQTQVSVQIGETGAQLASVALDAEIYPVQEAHMRLQEIEATRGAYSNRAADAQHDLGYLTKQAARLEELLAKLKGEQTEFRSQMMGISRQIDAIGRNERLINLLERRNKTIEECDRYESASLQQINGKLTQIQSKQEAALDLLASEERATDYEDVARMQIANEEFEESRALAEPKPLVPSAARK
jgi:chromosome segregation ATPase